MLSYWSLPDMMPRVDDYKNNWWIVMTARNLFLVFVGMLILLSGCRQADAPLASETEPESGKFLVEGEVPHAMLPDNVNPTEYRLHMTIDPDQDGYSGVVEIDVNIRQATKHIWLHGKNMTVSEGTIALADGNSLPIQFTELPADEAPSGIAKITSDTIIPAGEATLRLPYETPFNLSLNSAYKVVRGEDAYVVTQFEPLGAREAFPSFDEPRFKIPFTVSITAPNEDFVYANTPKVATSSTLDGWTKYEFQKTLPLPTYLIAFGVGPYDVVEYDPLPPTPVRDHAIPLRGIAARGEGVKFEYALANTAGILEAIEEYFDIPYPYEKIDLIAAPDYAFGAMENPGAIVYREYLLLMDENAPLSQKRAYASVHSHELAHQWFGNLVTPYWWEDIWLNEAFATWMGNKGITTWKPDGNFDRNNQRSALGTMNLDSLANTRAIRTTLERSERVMDQFDSITYRKGGGVLSMIESYLGEENFRKGVQLHMKRFEHGVASADDFFQSLADGSGNADVVDALKTFVDQPGLPLVNVDKILCPETVEASLEITQSRYKPLGSKVENTQAWEIPLCVNLGASNDAENSCMILRESKEGYRQFLMTQERTCPSFIMPNANGAGYYRFTMSTENWAKLIDNMDKLNTREVLATQDSLLAAYRAGEVESSVYLKGVEAFAKHPEYDVVDKAGDLLGFMNEHLPDTARLDYERFVRDIYAERYESLKGKDTTESQLLTPTLLGNLMSRANDVALKTEYAELGARYLGLDADAADKGAVPSNLLGFALGAVLESREDEAFDVLLDIYVTGSPRDKGVALRALTGVKSEDRVAQMLEWSLDDAGPISGRDSAGIVYSFMQRDELEDMAWSWLKSNFDVYVEKRVPDVRRASMPAFASGFCSKDLRDDAESFFKSKADLIPGYERTLAQTLETIELCTALKNAKIVELADALRDR